MDKGLAMTSEARYREVRRWYARDRGRTTALEILQLIDGRHSNSQAA